MKKLLAMALALVMCLGVTTMAWAEGDPTLSNGVWSNVTKDNVQDLLDGKYGSIDNTTIVLSAGTYGQLELGRATKHANSGTKYYVGLTGGGSDATEYTFEQFLALKNNGQWSDTPRYVRSMSNVTIKAADGVEVKVAGVYASSGHKYQNAHDYVLDRDVENGNSYYLVNNFANIAFEGITFTAKSNIESSLEQSTIDGFTFTNCTFDINNTASGNQAIRYYNENDNGAVKNLKVYDCVFNQCYQGVYAHSIDGVEVVGCAFNTTGHNAIAVQSTGDQTTAKGTIIIKENYITGAGDRAIRFNNVSSDATITINNNIMVNSGDDRGQLFKAENINGATIDLKNNYWDGKDAATAVSNNGGVTVPTETGVTAGTFKGEVTAAMLAEGVEAVPNGDGTFTVREPQPETPPRYYYNSTTTTTKDDTKTSSPKTFDAGVGVYAVSAILSVTGMAYVGKKKF